MISISEIFDVIWSGLITDSKHFTGTEFTISSLILTAIIWLISEIVCVFIGLFRDERRSVFYMINFVILFFSLAASSIICALGFKYVMLFGIVILIKEVIFAFNNWYWKNKK